MVFYGRDVRGGLGERTVGRLMLHRLAEINPESAHAPPPTSLSETTASMQESS